MDKDSKVIGIDIGGTKVQIGLVQGAKVVNEVRLSTSALAPQEQIIKEIVNGIEEVFAPDVAGIGIGVPGLVDEDSGVVHNVLNIPSWNEVYLKVKLEDYFKKPVHITNDANSFAAGEKVYGRGKDFRNMVGITLGTGFGTGIIIDHAIYSGKYSSAGEFGGVPYLDMTIEDYCSGKFFDRVYGLSGVRLQELAKQEDRLALQILNEYGMHLGNALKVILYAISPDAVFLGGSISGCYDYFKDSMKQSLQTFPFKIVTDTLVIERSSLDNAAVLGAAALFSLRSTQKLPAEHFADQP